MSDEKKFTIKRGAIDITGDRSELVEVTGTPDGISFKFKGGLRILIDDQYMPLDVKTRVSTADTAFKNANLDFNLNDYANPVVANID